jgi:hypothetical protein
MTVTALAAHDGVHADVQTRRDALQHDTYPAARRRLVDGITVMLAELAGITGGLIGATPYGYDIDEDVEQSLDAAIEALDLVRARIDGQAVYRPAVDTSGWGAGLTTATRQPRHLALLGGAR